MKYWKKWFEIYEPLQVKVFDEDAMRTVREAYDDGLHTGFDIGSSRLADEILTALEQYLSNKKMKRKQRRGFVEAMDIAYAMCDAYENETMQKRALKPYWTATNSWADGDGFVTSEWDSHD